MPTQVLCLKSTSMLTANKLYAILDERDDRYLVKNDYGHKVFYYKHRFADISVESKFNKLMLAN